MGSAAKLAEQKRGEVLMQFDRRVQRGQRRGAQDQLGAAAA